jgi:hypothetical protein
MYTKLLSPVLTSLLSHKQALLTSLNKIPAASLILGLLTIGQAAHAFNCGNGSSGHCYGRARWIEQPQYFGTQVDISEVTMVCANGSGCFFIDNETWLADFSSPGCVNNGFGACWVETGILATSDKASNVSSGRFFFWADARPAGVPSTFNLHIFGYTDPNGDTDTFVILQDNTGSAGVFQAFINNYARGTYYKGFSTNNLMSANRITIGQELAGTNGANADICDFTNNFWVRTPLGVPMGYDIRFERDIGSVAVRHDDPPFAEWGIPPLLPGNGDFETQCCSTGF